MRYSLVCGCSTTARASRRRRTTCCRSSSWRRCGRVQKLPVFPSKNRVLRRRPSDARRGGLSAHAIGDAAAAFLSCDASQLKGVDEEAFAKAVGVEARRPSPNRRRRRPRTRAGPRGPPSEPSSNRGRGRRGRSPLGAPRRRCRRSSDLRGGAGRGASGGAHGGPDPPDPPASPKRSYVRGQRAGADGPGHRRRGAGSSRSARNPTAARGSLLDQGIMLGTLSRGSSPTMRVLAAAGATSDATSNPRRDRGRSPTTSLRAR